MGCYPDFVTAVQPLKTGKGILQLSFVQLLHPVRPVARTVNLKIVVHTPTYLVGTILDQDGTLFTVTVSTVDFDWLSSYSQLLWKHLPPKEPTLFLEGTPLGMRDAQGYLSATFGQDAPAIIAGATSRSFHHQDVLDPDRVVFASLGLTAQPFGAWLIARGFIPTDMAEKWFIYLDDYRLIFRRSWTGIKVYEVDAQWRGESLYLGQVKINRDPRQYTETDEDYDRRLLIYLIETLLLRTASTLPIPKQPPSD